jgi:hypothetical protein
MHTRIAAWHAPVDATFPALTLGGNIFLFKLIVMIDNIYINYSIRIAII